jgi:hypothetical protein
MVVVTKKNIRSKNAISAMDPALTSGAARFAITLYLNIFLIPDNNIAAAAVTIKM